MEDRVILWWRGDFWFLDNSYQIPITFQNLTYPTVTHAMMAAQTEQLMLKVEIAQAPLAALKGLSEKIGDPYDGFQGPSTMRKLLENKFGYSGEVSATPAKAELAQKLIATGDRILIYGNNSCSTFWGDCACPFHFAEKGQNVLGGLLMGVRERLIEYITKDVNLDQTCSCENPSEAFFMYALADRLWLKPFCKECEAKTGVKLATDRNTTIRRFEKRWVKQKKPVNTIILPNSHLRPEIFHMQRQQTFDETGWERGWQGHLANRPVEPEPKLPQNITFYLSGRIA